MIGAVLGISRNEMKEQFPILSEALLYGVYPGIVKKESWSFTMRVLGAEIAPPKNINNIFLLGFPPYSFLVCKYLFLYFIYFF